MSHAAEKRLKRVYRLLFIRNLFVRTRINFVASDGPQFRPCEYTLRATTQHTKIFPSSASRHLASLISSTVNNLDLMYLEKEHLLCPATPPSIPTPSRPGFLLRLYWCTNGSCTGPYIARARTHDRQKRGPDDTFPPRVNLRGVGCTSPTPPHPASAHRPLCWP